MAKSAQATEVLQGASAGGHRAAKRALELIEHVAASSEPVSLSELARQVDLPKSSAHALARTLADEGYLLRDGRGAYALGPRLLALLGRLPHRFELPRVARPIMQQLVDDLGETAILGIRQGPQVIYIEQIEAPQMIRYVAPLGEPRPLHATSIGKIMLASMSPDDADALLRETKLERFTEHTTVSLRALKAELAAIREQGYALNQGESMAGIAAIAVPVRQGGAPTGSVIAGISMTGPASRMNGDLSEAHPRLEQAAQQIGAGVQAR
jgi:IclR family acetate operon transcriptional repressor